MTNVILDRLAQERIFEVEKMGDGDVVITEKCDEYFSVRLTPAELMQLTVELRSFL